MSDFRIIPVPEILSRASGAYVGEVEALLSGKAIFVSGWRSDGIACRAIRQNIRYRTDNARRLVSRQQTIDGESGLALWLVERSQP